MKCSLCGHEFAEEEGTAACGSCPFSHGCSMVRCPNCGFEIPLEPGWFKKIKAWRRRADGAERKS